MKNSPNNNRDTMCLCSDHRNWYIEQGYRVKPAGGNSGTCDKCNFERRGYDYKVIGFLSRTH